MKLAHTLALSHTHTHTNGMSLYITLVAGVGGGIDLLLNYICHSFVKVNIYFVSPDSKPPFQELLRKQFM